MVLADTTRRTWTIGLACAALVLVAGCVAPVAPTSPAAGATSSTDATGVMTIQVEGRPVLLYLPPGKPLATPAALVVVLHGYTGDAAGTVQFFGLRPLAEERGLLIAAPQGTTDSDGHTFWNASRACCDFYRSGVDDSSFLSSVITAAAATRPVDPGRVFVVGHSNGGFMAHRLACEHADQVAAIASLAGAMDTDATCDPSRPVSVLQVHGQADETISYDGGENNGEPYTSATQTVARWRDLDGCAGNGRHGTRIDADTKVAGTDLTPTTWTGCRGGTGVALWTIAHGSHVPSLTPAFAAALLDWFEAHARHS